MPPPMLTIYRRMLKLLFPRFRLLCAEDRFMLLFRFSAAPLFCRLILEALFNGPRGLALAIDGRLFIADSGNYRIRCLHFDGSNVLVSRVCLHLYVHAHTFA